MTVHTTESEQKLAESGLIEKKTEINLHNTRQLLLNLFVAFLLHDLSDDGIKTLLGGEARKVFRASSVLI